MIVLPAFSVLSSLLVLLLLLLLVHQYHRLLVRNVLIVRVSGCMIYFSLMLQQRSWVQRMPSFFGARAWVLPSIGSPLSVQVPSSSMRGRQPLQSLNTHLLRMDLRDQEPLQGLNATTTPSSTSPATRSSNSSLPPLLTTALLRISYDGSRFTGWSAGNDKAATNKNHTKTTTVPPNDSIGSNALSTRKKPRRRRRRSGRSPFVRSVQGVLQTNLAKLYGNVDPRRVVVEGCSRTDKGVHAVGMVAQFYCLSEEAFSAMAPSGEQQQQQEQYNYPEGQPSIPGKRAPHPWNATDTSCFVPLRQKHLSQLAFALNRMVYPDMQVMAYAPTPTSSTTTSKIPFHPTLAPSRKTYRYRFSVGTLHDPTQCRYVWHVRDTAAAASNTTCTNNTASDNPNNSKDGMCGGCWTTKPSVLHACAALQGRHNFAAFQGAPRGADDKRKRLRQDTTCCLHQVTLRRTGTWVHSSATATYTLELSGDRFLYKMVRSCCTGAIKGIAGVFFAVFFVSNSLIQSLTFCPTQARFLAGAIVAVGRDQMTVAAVKRLLETGERAASDHAGGWECAPAHALQLHKVEYDDIEYTPIDWQVAKC